MHIDQSRARPKTFDGLYSKISIFLLLAKSVATETFFPPALTHFHHNHLQLHLHHHHHHRDLHYPHQRHHRHHHHRRHHHSHPHHPHHLALF